MNAVPSSETVGAVHPETARVPLGRLAVDPVTLAEAVARVVDLIRAEKGGYVLTPNVDHVCLVERDEELRSIYSQASLVLTDGKPLVWLSQIIKRGVPEKVSGSDITVPLLQALRDSDQSVYFLGATDDVCAQLIVKLHDLVPGLKICGHSSPMYNPVGDDTEFIEALKAAVATKPDVVLFALGSPKQELALGRYREIYSPAIGMGVGATFDFLVGVQKRAPTWVSNAGLEWVYRLASNPKRLWRRYLVDDRAIVKIAFRQWREGRSSSRTSV
jgi:N-acetylglucosaminyldiphosphoundecaprenol N-acetyl-beta-D-mannosaminyltransferase